MEVNRQPYFNSVRQARCFEPSTVNSRFLCGQTLLFLLGQFVFARLGVLSDGTTLHLGA